MNGNSSQPRVKLLIAWPAGACGLHEPALEETSQQFFQRIRKRYNKRRSQRPLMGRLLGFMSEQTLAQYRSLLRDPGTYLSEWGYRKLPAIKWSHRTQSGLFRVDLEIRCVDALEQCLKFFTASFN